MSRRRTGRRQAVKQRKRWYGQRRAWLAPLEAEARRVHGANLRALALRGRRVYCVPVDVPGRLRPVEITITFYEQPPYPCFGLSAPEYPRVLARTEGTSPHRMPVDGALCLYYPGSPPELRWRPENGLLSLIDLARDHIFFEDYWRETGGVHGGEWLGDEQPHGFLWQVNP